MRMAALLCLLMVGHAGAQTQTELPTLPPPAQNWDPDAFAKADRCIKGFATRFAGTTALPQDVADAALQACRKERSMAAVARMHGGVPTIPTLQADEPEFRRIAILALLEARYPKAR